MKSINPINKKPIPALPAKERNIKKSEIIVSKRDIRITDETLKITTKPEDSGHIYISYINTKSGHQFNRKISFEELRNILLLYDEAANAADENGETLAYIKGLEDEPIKIFINK